jgi:hypothetical protein
LHPQQITLLSGDFSSRRTLGNSQLADCVDAEFCRVPQIPNAILATKTFQVAETLRVGKPYEAQGEAAC